MRAKAAGGDVRVREALRALERLVGHVAQHLFQVQVHSRVGRAGRGGAVLQHHAPAAIDNADDLHEAALARADALQQLARAGLDEQAVVLLVLGAPNLQHCTPRKRGRRDVAHVSSRATCTQLPSSRARRRGTQARRRTRHGGVTQLDRTHVNLGAQRVDNLLDHVAVAARALFRVQRSAAGKARVADRPPPPAAAAAALHARAERHA